MVENCGDELVPSRYIQTEEELFKIPVDNYWKINDLMNEVLSYLNSISGIH